MNCFSIPINDYTSDELIRELSKRAENVPFWIVTANPEILLYAKNNPSYKHTLLNADARIVDSFGLQMTGLLYGMFPHRLTGVDCAESLVSWAHRTGQSVAFIGGKPQVSAKAFARMVKKYPGLRGFTEDGGMIDEQGIGDEKNNEMIMRLTLQEPDIILVAFGHPKQERWIERVRSSFPKAKVIIGVGGTFDYWAQVVKRAPRWIRIIGLEWLYRLIKEPKRWRRIINAVCVFPFYALIDRFSSSQKQ